MTSVSEYYNNRLEYHAKDLCKVNVRHAKVMETLNNMKCLRGKKVLDAGCGVGALSVMMTKAGADVVGIDVADALIDHAKKHAAQERVEFKCEDIFSHNGNYDVVVLCDIFEHLPAGSNIAVMGKIMSFTESENAKIYLNIPDGRFLETLKAKSPQKCQIIDEPYSIDRILSLFDFAGFTPLYINIYGIDSLCQYNEYFFIKKDLLYEAIFRNL